MLENIPLKMRIAGIFPFKGSFLTINTVPVLSGYNKIKQSSSGLRVLLLQPFVSHTELNFPRVTG